MTGTHHNPDPVDADFDPASRRNASTLIELAIAEDLGTEMPWIHLDQARGAVVLDFEGAYPHPGDITTASTIPAHARGAAAFVARRAGVVAGLPVVKMLARRLALSWLEFKIAEGTRVERGDIIATIHGPMRDLLFFERTALNFLQRLSGIATLTSQFVEAVAGTRAVILDTRKTLPGWRALEKYAVRRGGGSNHRIGLYDQVLIKDNHLAWLAYLGSDDPVTDAVSSARREAGAGIVVEVEVDSLEQFDRALHCGPDIILIDNLGPDLLAAAVRRRDQIAPGILLEASGGVTLATVAGLARAGVDRISVGALTHSAPALDIALDFDESIPT